MTITAKVIKKTASIKILFSAAFSCSVLNIFPENTEAKESRAYPIPGKRNAEAFCFIRQFPQNHVSPFDRRRNIWKQNNTIPNNLADLHPVKKEKLEKPYSLICASTEKIMGVDRSINE